MGNGDLTTNASTNTPWGRWRRARERTRRLGAGLRVGGRLFVYQSRLALSRQTVFLIVALCVFLSAVVARSRISSPRECLQVLQAFQCAVFILLCMGLVTHDRDKGLFEMTLVSSPGFHQLILMKFVPAAFWALALGAAAAGALDWLVGGFPLATGFFFAYTTGLLAGMTTLSLSVYTRSAYAAAAATALAAFGIYHYYEADLHVAVLDPFLQVFSDELGQDRLSLFCWNRFYTLALTGLLYDQTVRRMRRMELWVK
ncbi:MAG: hypothetical protein NTW86_21535 [Candidatus Sumerlaeota bacterium]|nr:hypothetical protein [Candidatus Sumerlaeota bacterium]